MKVNLVDRVELPNLKLFKRGKVRDIYELDDRLLLVATDRVSCFDVVLDDPIPYKGVVLTQLSVFWFQKTENIIPNHLITSSVEGISQLDSYSEILEGRTMVVKKSQPIPFECVVRGYLAGSGWRDYKNTGEVSGIKLPPGLKEAEKLEEPIFTPSTKEETGHDMAVTFDYMVDKIGVDIASRIREKSIELYKYGAEYAEQRGIIIADTKFEFGILDGELILIDELFTPDSSRFWPKDEYQPGKSQVSFDKQYLRDWLESTGWDKTPPPPRLPQDVIHRTSEKYRLAFKMLTARDIV
ncbi:MAG: phosphoribosylaminoimidazolesuccinocarboxamide synthase [Candidatus Omnitrophota bacterium]|nr:MAG: phosphoribosylaminoimidazolesuccinocarboxamide synthase [Candidatus Omnitrophota bacterium]